MYLEYYLLSHSIEQSLLHGLLMNRTLNRKVSDALFRESRYLAFFNEASRVGCDIEFDFEKIYGEIRFNTINETRYKRESKPYSC